MKLFSALPLLLSLEPSSAFTTRNLQSDLMDIPLTEVLDENATKFYEPPAAFNETIPMYYNDTVYPDGFWMKLEEPFMVYDTFGLMNATSGFIQYAPMAVESSIEYNLTDMPVAYYTTTGNASFPLYNVPRSFLRGGDETAAFASMPLAMAMDAPMVSLATSPVEDMAMMVDTTVYIPVSMGNDALQAPEFSSEMTTPLGTLPVVLERFVISGNVSSPEMVLGTVTSEEEGEPVMMDEPTTMIEEPEMVFGTVTSEEEDGPVMMDEQAPSGNGSSPEMVFGTVTSEEEDGSVNATEIERPTLLVPNEKPTNGDNVTGSVTSEQASVIEEATLFRGEPVSVQSQAVPIKKDSNKPVWSDLIKASYKGTDLKTCKKKNNIAPANGAKCTKTKVKTCYFGNQQCATAYPDTVCKCTGGVWACSPVACP